MDDPGLTRLASSALRAAAPLLAGMVLVLGTGAVRRLALRLALRSAWRENTLALLVLKTLGHPCVWAAMPRARARERVRMFVQGTDVNGASECRSARPRACAGCEWCV